MKSCINKGCNNSVDPNVNPLWCPDCNDVRIARITKRLDEMAAEMKPQP
jgi:hypothetical protein